MSFRAPIALGLVVIACLFALRGWLSAQALRSQAETPIVLAGSDIGFRVEGRRGNIPIGKLVVRIDGQWVEAQFAGGMMKLTQR